VNATADQKARLLEVRVAENSETIEQLRQERALLTTDHKELQHHFSEISEVSRPSNIMACVIQRAALFTES